MTRYRVYGEDSPFGAWLRSQPQLDSRRDAIVASDVDFMIHRYMTPVDTIGTRDVHYMMHLEVKTRGGSVHPSQLETLWFTHQLIRNTGQKFRRTLALRGQGHRSVFHFGVTAILLDGTTPEDSAAIRWGRFGVGGDIDLRQISLDQLVSLLRCDIHPDTFMPISARRHHKRVVLYQTVTMPLGFTVDKPEVIAS